MVDPSFWKSRRVFLTGHTGFKGSWLSLWLARLGADLTGYSLEPPTTPSLFEQASVADAIPTTFGDIRDFPRLRAAIDKAQPEVILHLAAQSVVKRGYDDPIETYSSNVMGTVHVMEAVRQLKLPCVFVNVTSDKCYANQEWVWGYRENEPMGGRDPYSNSKGCAELVTTAYRESFFPPATFEDHGVALASARAGNAIGGGDWTSNQLIPDAMRAFLEGQPCLIRNPSAIRPWQFVLEPLHGYLVLAEHLAKDPVRFASGWNFGPVDTDAQPVSAITTELARLWGSNALWTLDGAAHPREANFLKLDISKSRSSLAWRPVLPVKEALEWIVDWYKAFQGGQDMRSFTLAQIEKFENRTAARDLSILN
jgi:CDP-glucose 4,6-dehydratase